MCQSSDPKKKGESSEEDSEEDEGKGERTAPVVSLSSEHYKQLVFPEGYNTNTYSVAESRTGSIGTGSLLSRRETLRNIESHNDLSFEPIPEEDQNVDRSTLIPNVKESNVDRNIDFSAQGY